MIAVIVLALAALIAPPILDWLAERRGYTLVHDLETGTWHTERRRRLRL